MPPSGLKYATVGLTGPLNTCVRSYDIITPGSRDQHVLLTKINIEKMRLVAWGRAVGVCTATNAADTEHPPSESLLRPDIRVALFETLNSIQLTFTDADRLVSQYGLQQNLANSTQQQFLRGSEDFPGSIRWCLKDQALDLLASHLHGFNNSLLALIPDRAADANRLVEAEIDSVDDVDRLQMLEDASTELNADICGMAIIRRILFKNGQLRSRSDASRHSVLLQYFSGLSSVPLKDVVELAQPSHPPRRGTPQKDMVEPAEPNNPPRLGTPSDGAHTPRSFQFTPPVPTHNALEAEEPDLASCHVIQPQDPDGYTYGQNLAPIVAALRAADKNRFIDSCNQPYRLAAEVRKARTDADYFGYITPVGDDISDLIGCFEGPLFTPYQGGIFFISVSIPPDYPMQAPRARFLTKVYHPNVCPNGAIHADIFGGFWSPAITLEVLLLSVSVLLSEPNPDESVVLDVAELCRSDRDRYNATAERFTALYATADQVSLDRPRVWCG